MINSSATATSSLIYNNWIDGMTSLNKIIDPANVNLTKSILWYYYQSYYNNSFTPATHQVQFN